jgi:outer membrane protein assembly factor BamD (BamD/ComL family)
VAAATLARELAAVDAARTAVAQHQPRRALGLLDAYTRTYPDGSLAPEAEILRIDALAQSGHRAAAHHHAETFLRRHPSSVLAARARQYLTN